MAPLSKVRTPGKMPWKTAATNMSDLTLGLKPARIDISALLIHSKPNWR